MFYSWSALDAIAVYKKYVSLEKKTRYSP